MNNRQKIVQAQFLNDEEAVINRLKTVYNKSNSDITKKIKSLDSSIANLQKALADVGEDDIGNLAASYLKNMPHLTPEEAKETLQSMIQSKVYQKNYQKALKTQVDGIMDTMQEKQFSTVSDYLSQCYENGFIGTMYDLQGQGIPMCIPIDQSAMVRAVQLNSKISQGLYSRLGEDVAMLKKKITAQVSRGISSGMSYKEVAQQLAGQTKIGFNNAVRIARTEGHRIQAQSTMDAAYMAQEKGADLVKQWDAALDSRTRESHTKVDGEIRELDKPFSNGLMFPGDPSGGAAEVVNCRCALLQRARWALDEEELEELKKRAEYFGLDKTEQFEDFKKKYLQAAEQADFVDNPFVMIDDPPPMLREFTNAADYRKAMADYAEKHPGINPREFYVEDSNWFGIADEDERAKVKQFDSTIKKLQDDFPLPPGDDKLFIGTMDGVEYQLTDIQRSRLDGIAKGQQWTNPETNTTIIGFNPNHSSGTLLDDLSKRQKKLDGGEILENVLDNSPEGTAIHEWGHSMSEYLMNGMVHDDPNSVEYYEWYKSLSKDDITKGLSRYATTNKDEFEAECFAELLTGNPRPIAKKYGEYLEKASDGKISFKKVLTNAGKDDKIKLADINKMVTPYERKVLDSIPKKEGFFDFAAHGTPNAIGYGTTVADMSARELANIIRRNKDYHGQKVRLLSCSTGATDDGFAQQLANALGVEVEAPTDILLVWPNGTYIIGYDGSGEMKTFKPGGKG